MKFTTRLAPSPTGFLHLGNAWAFLLCWLAARKHNGVVRLRIDDIDPLRSKKEFADAIIHDLTWLGLDWDGVPFFQRSSLGSYQYALDALQHKGLTYPCFCTRKELRSVAGAPHSEDQGAPYPGTCASLPLSRRNALIDKGKPYSLRLRCHDSIITFDDLLQGPQAFTSSQYGGDFPLVRSDGVWAYQLASPVDDAAMGVNFIARGRDLLSSTPRQILLGRHLGYSVPVYMHIPLLLDAHGERLAKRHASLSLSALREQGVPAARITGMLGTLAGINPRGVPLTPSQLLPFFDINILSRSDISLTPEKLAFLAHE